MEILKILVNYNQIAKKFKYLGCHQWRNYRQIRRGDYLGLQVFRGPRLTFLKSSNLNHF